MQSEAECYHELCAWTLSLRDTEFIHQVVVDSWCAQNADESTKPIALTFALVGLYLHVEQKVSGKQVQRVHMKLAERRQQWPRFALPGERGSRTVTDVIAKPAGAPRNEAIEEWAAAVWAEYAAARETIIALLRENGIDPSNGLSSRA